ncbi:hypothetical protein WJX74_009799 [Apatococcus lobatus]|uniref:Uncharacterized protein n=1 Tax=Apatococcus lobatus TaxID=904363 RepID=A0AAW1RCP3_9CHLO
MEESLISKGTAKQEWLLTDGDMRKLGSITKENPHKKEWSAMRLYLLSQVEKRSMEKHGDLDGLEAEKQRQLHARLDARKRQRKEASVSREDREAQKLRRIRGRIEDELRRDSSEANKPQATAEVSQPSGSSALFAASPAQHHLPGLCQMKEIRFEIWKEGTKVQDTEYEGPLTRDEALSALREENPLWQGKLTAKDSKIGLRGPGKLDSSKIYVLWLADSPGDPARVAARPSGPVQHNLQQMADALTGTTSGCYMRLGPAGQPGVGEPRGFVVDEDARMQHVIHAWLDGCAMAPETFDPTLLHQMVPLVIPGVTKVGKSFCLDQIVPAVAARHAVFGVSKRREVIVIKLVPSAVRLSSAQLLRNFLDQLMDAWEDRNMEVSQKLWRECCASLQSNNAEELTDTIRQLVRSLRQHTLFLLDEAQWLMLPWKPADEGTGQLDMATAKQHLALLKLLMYHTSPFALWALTGSTMATVWWGLANMAANGAYPLNANYALHLPPTVSSSLVTFCWQQLQQQYGGVLPEELKLFAGNCPALLCAYAAEWHYHSVAASGLTLHELISNCDRKWLVETAANWMPIFKELLPLERRNVGARESALRSCFYRMTIQVLLRPDGSFTDDPSKEVVMPMASLQAEKLMLHVCNLIIEGEKANFNRQVDSRTMVLVEDLGTQIRDTTGLQPAGWFSQPWFTAALNSPWNTMGAAKYVEAQQKKGEMDLVGYTLSYMKLLTSDEAHTELGLLQPPGANAIELCPLGHGPLLTACLEASIARARSIELKPPSSKGLVSSNSISQSRCHCSGAAKHRTALRRTMAAAPAGLKFHLQPHFWKRQLPLGRLQRLSAVPRQPSSVLQACRL